jgi:uncharacterized membrane protein
VPKEEDSVAEKKKATGWQRNMVIGADRLVRRVAVHWLLLINLLVFIYVGLPFLAPVLAASGATGPANTIYTAYGFVCHQFAFRSWYIGGDQVAYPRERAGTDLESFESYASQDPYFSGVDVETLDTQLIVGARVFRGNEQMGHKVAFCQRDVAIYGGIFLAGLTFALLRGKVKPLKFWQYVLLGIVPIGLDGFSQLFANPPFDQTGLGLYTLIGQISQAIFGIRESTPFLRSLTGFLFGLANVWLAYPHLEEAMKETRERVEAQLNKAGLTY